MAIFIHIDILLGFLAPLIYIKRSLGNVAKEEEETTEEKKSEINEEIKDMTDIKSKIKDLTDRGVLDRVEAGLPVRPRDFKQLEDIKKEFESYFDPDSGNNLKQGLKEVSEYLGEEIANLSKDKPSEGSSTPLEDDSKRRKIDDSSDLPVEMPSIFDDVD
jgi:hypothetical protein